MEIDTLWHDNQENEAHWLGRVCKVYTLTNEDWKLIGHSGALLYDQSAEKS